jgi:hypothetical protein
VLPIFFTPTPSGQAAGAAFIGRLAERKQDLDGASGAEVANAQMAAFREWERFRGEHAAAFLSVGSESAVF